MIAFKKVIEKIDTFLCSFFGLKSYETRLGSVHVINNEVIVSNLESHKRLFYKENWQDFTKATIKGISEDDKTKLGIALGKTLADNLVISFEKSKVHI